jgi:formate hydrogenlyase subunit 3/multisubunit Na+/H+ antiporter MnhD subunit
LPPEALHVAVVLSPFIQDARKCHVSLFALMGAMLGVVLADNVLTLFVFWDVAYCAETYVSTGAV